MSDLLKIEIRSDAAEVMKKVAAYPQVLTGAVAAAMDRRNNLTVGHIVATKLTAAGPKFLNRDTGRLGGSARATKAVAAGASVSSSIGSNVLYAGLHEYGFTGTVLVKAFMRKAPSGDRFSLRGSIVSRVLATKLGAFGKNGRARSGVSQTSSRIAMVKPHSRKMNLPARAMFRTGIDEQLPFYKEDISNAIVKAWEGKK